MKIPLPSLEQYISILIFTSGVIVGFVTAIGAVILDFITL